MTLARPIGRFVETLQLSQGKRARERFEVWPRQRRFIRRALWDGISQVALLAEPDPKPEVTWQDDAKGRKIRDSLGPARLGNFTGEAFDRGQLNLRGHHRGANHHHDPKDRIRRRGASVLRDRPPKGPGWGAVP